MRHGNSSGKYLNAAVGPLFVYTVDLNYCTTIIWFSGSFVSDFLAMKGMDNVRIPRPMIPVSTYRLQFNSRFTFSDATRIISYLHDLGISDIYASPYFRSKKGSLHGYDIVDHNTLNPEIGTKEDYRAMIAELKRNDMGQILDIVPNHMCVDSSENRWWMDVLENGHSSPYAKYFDIDWAPVKKELRDKVLIPVLGDQYGNVLERQELNLAFAEGSLFISYYEHRFPLRPQTYVFVLEHRLRELQAALPAENPDHAEFLSIITALRHLPPYRETDTARIEERYREKEVIKRRLQALISRCPEVRAFIEENLRLFNGTRGDPRSFDLLDELLNQQIYRLSHWQVATEEINYRRFFDINGLGAIRMEHDDVFQAAHQLIFRLIGDGSVTGLRIDHPDGLFNPVEYFHRLQRTCYIRQMIGPDGTTHEKERELAERYDEAVLADPAYRPFYIVGEKILIKAERMPDDWPIFSTTGYVFLNSVNGIFIASGSAQDFDRIYEKFTDTKMNVPEVIYDKKKLVMHVNMASEVNTLGHYLNDLSERNRHTRDFTLNSLRSVITEVIACFPVYRTYTNSWTVTDRDRQVIELAVSKAKRKNPVISESIFDFLKDVLLLRFTNEQKDGDKASWLDFAMRFQQITGPVTAKGVEDTAFYVYNRLVSLNEVGGMPERFGTPLETFHGQNIERSKSWPHALITTATHDTKRGEDMRQRINVLSEIPREWSESVKGWARVNKKKKIMIEGVEAPDRNEEYLLYQTLIGAWPVEAMDERSRDTFVGRIRDYMLKASREAKVNTSWINPNRKYEEALTAFAGAILKPVRGNRFLIDFLPFQQMVSHYGMFNSLSQALLKICSPGVPDFYQGTELWDFSLVDPDNRRPIDYEKRIGILAGLRQKEMEMTGVDLAWELSLAKEDGRIKLYLIHKALNYRRAKRSLFEEGEYLPLEAEGIKAENICAFVRRAGRKCVVTAVPRFLTRIISGGGSVPFGKAVWEDTRLTLTIGEPGMQFRNVFTGEIVTAQSQGEKTSLLLADVFACFPAAMLERIP
jgi:(1->4)-alpha-D-glucan 1-alpha-D-glucosylmutase